MLRTVDMLDSEPCAVPEAAVAKARQLLCVEYGVVLDEGLEQGAGVAERSRYFIDLWEKFLAEAADPVSKDLGLMIAACPPGGLITSTRRWGTLARGPSRLGVSLLLTPRTRGPFLRR